MQPSGYGAEGRTGQGRGGQGGVIPAPIDGGDGVPRRGSVKGSSAPIGIASLRCMHAPPRFLERVRKTDGFFGIPVALLRYMRGRWSLSDVPSARCQHEHVRQELIKSRGVRGPYSEQAECVRVRVAWEKTPFVRSIVNFHSVRGIKNRKLFFIIFLALPQRAGSS